MHLVGFTIEIYHDAQPYKRQKKKKKIMVLDAGSAQRTRTELYLNITSPSMQRSPTYSVPLKFSGKIFFKGICHVSHAR